MNEEQKPVIRETCKSHSTKVSDREFPRVHPTKLSKQELEDLYYAILDNNLELKQTINTQNEKIKQLSTKVQRLAALQKSGLGKNEKDCCLNAKALIKEQKDIIAEQKRANDRLSEKNRILNMRLCSAKQFLGKNSARCTKCCLAAAISIKNSSTSALNISTKRSVTNIQTSVSASDLIHKEPVSTKSTEVQTDCEKISGEVCNENKCKTLMEELKQKIASLEEELSKLHSEYLSRVSRLEQEVVVLRQEEAGKTLVLQHAEAQSGQLLQRLRAAETHCEEIAVQLSAEQRKVSELETRLRAAELTVEVARTMHQHNTDKITELHAVSEAISLECKEQQSTPTKRLSNVEEVKCPNTPQNSDDSGYVEAILLEEQKSPRKEISSELKDKISDLQTQLNSLKRLAPLTTGPLFEINNTDAHLLRTKAEQTLYENATEPTTSVQMSSFQKSSFNLPQPTKGILEKSDDLSKGYRKDEKVGKNVSYEDVMSDTDDFLPKDAKNSVKNTEPTDSPSFVGYSPSDDKHFVVAAPQKTVDCEIKDKEKEKRTEKRRSKEGSSPTNRSLEFKEERSGHHKAGRINKASKEKDIFDIENKDVAKINKAQMFKEKKKISIEVPESEVHLCSKEININISTCNSNPSTESSKEIAPSGQTSPKSPYMSQPTDKDDIKVIKDVRSNSDMNVAKTEIKKYPNEDQTLGHEIQIKKSKTKRNRNSIEQQIKNYDKRLDICEQHAVICTCPRAARRDVRVFRTCSGTGRFAAVAQTRPDTGLRHCACSASSGTQTLKFRDSGDGGTYVVHAKTAVRMCAPALDAAAGAADTDGEISGLTDLPDEMSGRSMVSAGEARAYATCTDTATSATDCVTLSEGELPLPHNAGRKLLSPGERRRKTSSGEISPPFSTSQRVEDALQTIGEELTRCRVLLQRQGPKVTYLSPLTLLTP